MGITGKKIGKAIAAGRVSLMRYWWNVWNARDLCTSCICKKGNSVDTIVEVLENFEINVVIPVDDLAIDHVITDFYSRSGYEVVCEKFGLLYDLRKNDLTTKRVIVENNSREAFGFVGVRVSSVSK